MLGRRTPTGLLRWLGCAGGVATIAGTLALVLAAPASATWSMVVADPESGQVGAAVASCVDISPVATFSQDDGSLDLLAVVPGVGAGASQADFNYDAPGLIKTRLQEGASAAAIIEELISPEFDVDAQVRQHAVVTLADASAPEVFTGSGDLPWAGSASADGVSAQGNILVSKAVVDDAVQAYVEADGTMQQRLAAGLLAGSRAGGDSRCGEQTALFAHIAVAQEDGSLLIYTTTVAEGDGRNPVELLAADVNNPSLSEGAVVDEGNDSSVVVIGLVALAALAVVIVAVIAIIVLIVRRRRRSKHPTVTEPFGTAS